MSPRVFWAFTLLCLTTFLFGLDLFVALAVVHQRDQTINTYSATIHTLQTNNQALIEAQKNPTFTVWNACGGPCNMTADQVRAGGAPDTFDIIISFTATTPITVHFMTLTGWTQFSNCSFNISCVSDQYHASSVGPVTSLNDYTFTLAEGCASYVIVFQASASGIITPDERVRYHPSSTATGACS